MKELGWDRNTHPQERPQRAAAENDPEAGDDGSRDAYQYLIQRLSEVLPDIADQVRQETGRGRVIAGSKLPTSDREVRETRMEQANAGRIGKSDILSGRL